MTPEPHDVPPTPTPTADEIVDALIAALREMRQRLAAEHPSKAA